MTPTRQRGKFGGFFFILVLGASLIWIFSQIKAQDSGSQNPLTLDTSQPTPPTEETAGQAAPEEKPAALSGLFYYVQIADQVTKLYSLKLSDQTSKLLYTDQDEANKVVRALGLDKTGNILVFEADPGNPTSAQLVAISSDGQAQKKVLFGNLSSANPPVISPQKDKLVLTNFSNAEKDFGFAMFIQNLDSSNKRLVATSSTNIFSPQFSDDQKKLAYIINQGEAGSKINVYDILSFDTLTALESEKVVTNLAWQGDNLILALSPLGTATANQSELYLLDLTTKVIKQLTDNTSNENDLFSFNQDQWLAYISRDLKQGVPNQNQGGQIKILDSELNLEKISANYLFGWQAGAE